MAEPTLKDVQEARPGADDTFNELIELFAKIAAVVPEDNMACAAWILKTEEPVPQKHRETFWKGVAALAVSTLYRERGERMEAE